MNTKPKKAVIVGAGLGGLATALRLAHRGWAVTVCEQADSPGGKMNRWETNGYRFDTGPSLITMPWVFEELFESVGTRLCDHVQLLSVHPMADYVFDDGTRFTHTNHLPDWLKTVRTLENGDASGFLRFMALGARLFEISKPTFFGRSPFEPPDPAHLKLLPRIPVFSGWGNYHATLRRFIHSPHLLQMFDRYMTYVGSSPYRAPATLFVIPFIEMAYGGWHVKGGLYEIIMALVRMAQARGAEVRTRTRVTALHRQADRVSGVELESGETLEADVVVLNGDAARTPSLLGEKDAKLPPESERSLSGLVFLFALRSALADRPHHSVFFSADYAAEFRQLFDERRFPDDPTVYVNLPSRTDRSLAPGSGEVMFVMANAPATDADPWDAAQIATARQRVMARLKKGGFPDIEEDIVDSDVWTPRRLADRYGMPGGSIYGCVSHGWRRSFLRPPNRDRTLPGLYRVGGSSHPGGGTPTVLMSAAITTRLIEKYENHQNC
ncbi:MAG: phytoene desaturase family protein [Kiritimatiellia bacterium]|nr:phytoene desaturase family protein [Kiritimatiellia bacterium]